jgi:thiol-disulfide isomerase/thioredoxin
MGIINKLLGRKTTRVMPDSLPNEGDMPEFDGLSGWLNSEPLTLDDLKGKVVLVDFWTLSCINCIRTLPHLKAWHETYKDSGLVVIGIHTPEFPFECEEENARKSAERFGLEYPIALDNDYAMWKTYRNHYWPTHYFVDREGRIRYHHFGEGNYSHSEAVIRALLSEDGSSLPEHTNVPDSAGRNGSRKTTPETYLGYERMEYLGSPESVKMDQVSRYTTVEKPAVNVFYLDGDWLIGKDWAEPASANAVLVFKVRATQIDLVMDAEHMDSKVEVRLDGSAVTANIAGADIESNEEMSVVRLDGGRMYEIMDTHGRFGEYELRLIFPESGVRLYSFTFG